MIITSKGVALGMLRLIPSVTSMGEFDGVAMSNPSSNRAIVKCNICKVILIPGQDLLLEPNGITQNLGQKHLQLHDLSKTPLAETI